MMKNKLQQHNASVEVRYEMKYFTSILCLFLIIGWSISKAQNTRVNGPAGSASFGLRITVLTNGNYVVTDPLYSITGVTHVGAVRLYNGVTHALISTITGSGPSDQVGTGGVTALTNGNFVISSPQWRNGGSTQAGAATWGNGTTGVSGVVSTLNSLVGSTPNDNVSSYGIKALPNGNYLTVSPHWEHNVLLMNDAGAVTWGSGSTGIAGIISESNSIVGSRWDDAVGSAGITILSNGNYVISSTNWGGSTPITSLGAVTWGNGNGGTVGQITAYNSLIGFANGDDIGSGGVKELNNGNYIVSSPKSRQGGLAEVGAVTWGNGATGISGVVNVSNSLVGSHASDQVGSSFTGSLVTLSNGNYVVASDSWDNGAITDAGAVTWCNGLTGRTGVVSSSNSLVGSSASDQIGGGSLEGRVIPLTNGNYVVSCPSWNNAAILNVGAVVWGNGTIGITGSVNSGNAIIGNQAEDQIGVGLTVLHNGHYVITSSKWDNGITPNVGATTWANGTMATTGTINTSNSIIGNATNDFISQKVTALTNGNYVIANPYWNNGAMVDVGAATWRNGTNTTSGTISITNAIIGGTANDNVGWDIVPLTNGNYAVGSRNWNNGAINDAGAITWGDGIEGTTGLVSLSNSLVGSSTSDNVGTQAITGNNSGIHALSNGNYVIESHLWDNGSVADAGAITLGNGNSGTFGVISSTNSLVGSTANDRLGYFFTSPLDDGNYLIRGGNWDNGAIVDGGSMTLGNGSFAQSGVITGCNSVLGNVANEGSSLYPAYNYTHGYLLVGASRENAYYIFNPTGQALVMEAAESEISVSGNNKVPFLIDGGCKILASIKPNGINPVSGKVHASVWIENTVPSTSGYPYVARHFQITPEKNTAKARVTLFLTHKNFLEFNNHPGSTLNLPSSSGDATGKSNLRVEKFAGKSNDGTGLPSSYTAGSEIIDPADADIIWNEQQERWEVSFDVTMGFSGFIVHTTANPLPVKLISFKGLVQEKNALLKWEITEAIDFNHFELERSSDAKNFNFIAEIDYSTKTNSYDYTDLSVLETNNADGKIYYRLKMIDLDNSFAYSRIIYLQFDQEKPNYLYPNPFTSQVSLKVKNHNNQKAKVQFITIAGNVLITKESNVVDNKIDLNQLKFPSGNYVLRIEFDSEIIYLKGIKAN